MLRLRRQASANLSGHIWLCPYCNNPAEWVPNEVIYGKQYGTSYMMYVCRPCDARVGTHNNTRKPFGTMANAELREWRIKAHAVIDPIWKQKKLPRGVVYNRLKKLFGREIHVGESDIATCQAIIARISEILPA